MRPSAIILSVIALACASLNGMAAEGRRPASPPGQTRQDSVRPKQGAEAPPKEKVEKIRPPGQEMQGDGLDGGEQSDEAQQAVEAGNALPLRTIIEIAEGRSSGKVIDAQLLTLNGTLLYRLTLLDAKGRSWREFYLARSGNPMTAM